MATKRLRSWFFTATALLFGHGTRFRKNDKPTQASYEDLFESVPFKLETGDRSTQTEQGLIRLATDTEASGRDSERKPDGFEMGVQPHQIPVLVAGDGVTILDESELVSVNGEIRFRQKQTISADQNAEFATIPLTSASFATDGGGTMSCSNAYLQVMRKGNLVHFDLLINEPVVSDMFMTPCYEYYLNLESPEISGTIDWFSGPASAVGSHHFAAFCDSADPGFVGMMIPCFVKYRGGPMPNRIAFNWKVNSTLAHDNDFYPGAENYVRASGFTFYSNAVS